MKKQIVVIYCLLNFIHCDYYTLANKALIIQADAKPDTDISYLPYKNNFIKINNKDSIDAIKINFLNLIVYLLDYVDSAFIFIYGLFSSSEGRADEKSVISRGIAQRVLGLLCMFIFDKNQESKIQYKSIQISQKTKQLSDLAETINRLIETNTLDETAKTFLQKLIATKSNNIQSDIVCNKNSYNAQELKKYMAALPVQLKSLVEEYTAELKAIFSTGRPTPCYIYSDHEIEGDNDLNSLVTLLAMKDKLLSETLNISPEYRIASAVNCTGEVSAIGIAAAIGFLKNKSKRLADAVSSGDADLSTTIDAILTKLLALDPSFALSMIHLFGNKSIIQNIIDTGSDDYKRFIEPLLTSIGNIGYISIEELKQCCEILKYNQEKDVRECKIDLFDKINALSQTKNKNLLQFIAERYDPNQSLSSIDDLANPAWLNDDLPFKLLDVVCLSSVLKDMEMADDPGVINLFKDYITENPGKKDIVNKLITQEYSDKMRGSDFADCASSYIKTQTDAMSSRVLEIMQCVSVILSLTKPTNDVKQFRKLAISSLKDFCRLIVDRNKLFTDIDHKSMALLYFNLSCTSTLSNIAKNKRLQAMMDHDIRQNPTKVEALKNTTATHDPDVYLTHKIAIYLNISGDLLSKVIACSAMVGLSRYQNHSKREGTLCKEAERNIRHLLAYLILDAPGPTWFPIDFRPRTFISMIFWMNQHAPDFLHYHHFCGQKVEDIKVALLLLVLLYKTYYQPTKLNLIKLLAEYHQTEIGSCGIEGIKLSYYIAWKALPWLYEKGVLQCVENAIILSVEAVLQRKLPKHLFEAVHWSRSKTFLYRERAFLFLKPQALRFIEAISDSIKHHSYLLMAISCCMCLPQVDVTKSKPLYLQILFLIILAMILYKNQIEDAAIVFWQRFGGPAYSAILNTSQDDISIIFTTTHLACTNQINNAAVALQQQCGGITQNDIIAMVAFIMHILHHIYTINNYEGALGDLPRLCSFITFYLITLYSQTNRAQEIDLTIHQPSTRGQLSINSKQTKQTIKYITQTIKYIKQPIKYILIAWILVIAINTTNAA